MPLLNKISEKGEMYLLNYKINSNSQGSFGGAVAALIPDMLKKLYLMDNNLTDSSVASMFQALSACQEGGLSSLSIINNQLGNLAISALTESFLTSSTAKYLKKFHIKSPVIISKNSQLQHIFQKLEQQS